MPASRPRTSRVFTISFPEPLARQVEETAREESRNISELFREAWRAYRFDKLERKLEAIRRALPPTSYTPDDVEAMVDEIRSEKYAKKQSRK
jgi:Arc/MetJ-type ribon-helix-helix transcriptional regulator